MSTIEIATKLINRSTGSHVLRSIYSVSETNTKANHSLDLVEADGIESSLGTAGNVSIDDIPADEAADMYASAPGAESRESYLDYEYKAITVLNAARGYNAGTEATYIVPINGW